MIATLHPTILISILELVIVKWSPIKTCTHMYHFSKLGADVLCLYNDHEFCFHHVGLERMKRVKQKKGWVIPCNSSTSRFWLSTLSWMVTKDLGLSNSLVVTKDLGLSNSLVVTKDLDLSNSLVVTKDLGLLW